MDAYDGVNLNPLEVVFVKVKGFLLQADWIAPKTLQTYDRWLSHQVCELSPINVLMLDSTVGFC